MFIIFPLLLSCNKDDDNTVEIRDRSDQVVLDEQTIEEYLRTHYYNYEDFSNPNSFEVDMKVRIDTITDSTSDRTPLFDQVNVKTINVEDSDGIETPHKLYYIIAREGIVSNPSIVDSVFITYKGMLTDNSIFDHDNWAHGNEDNSTDGNFYIDETYDDPGSIDLTGTIGILNFLTNCAGIVVVEAKFPKKLIFFPSVTL